MRLRRPVVALVLAGGAPRPAFGPAAPRFRPLLPVGGRPIVEHLLAALEQSWVERVLVFHDADCDLAGAMGAHAKAVFVPLPAGPPPLGESVRFALAATLRRCGTDATRRSRILILPCDLPLATPAAVNRALERADDRDFDFAYVAVSVRLLEERYPGRAFRSWFAADLGGRYTLQTAVLLDGSLLRAAPGDGVTIGDWSEEEAERLFRSISMLRRGRDSVWQVPQFLNELVVRRLSRNGGRALMAATLTRALLGRLRTTDLDRLTAAAYRLRTVCVDSGSPELSADIDTPADVEFYLRTRDAEEAP